MNTLNLILPGSVKSKKNSKRIIRVGGRYKPRRSYIIPSKAYLNWERSVRDYLVETNQFRRDLITSLCTVAATFYYKGPRPDLSGSEESLGDCLEGYIWENDKLISSWDGSELIHDKKNPRTEIVIRWN
jgi:hypothetical protein